MAAGSFLVRKLLEGESTEQVRNLNLVVDRGIDSDVFIEEIEQRAFAFMRDYFGRYARLPSLEIIEFEVGIELPALPDDSVEYWIDQVLNQHMQATLLRQGQQIVEAARANDISTAINCMREGYTEVSLRQIADRACQWTDQIPSQIEEHRLRQLGMDDPGVYVGMSYVDSVTMGIQPGDNWALVGRPEVGKSYILKRMLLGAHSAGSRVSVFSMEMPKEQWARRTTALATNISATLLRAGRVSFFAIERLQELLRELQSQGRTANYKIIEGRLNMTPADVLHEIQTTHPNVVGVDGAYLMMPSDRKQKFGSRWERGMAVCEEFKKISLQTGIPIVATYQFGRGGEKKGLEGIGMTDAIGQLASVVFSICNETDNQGPRGEVDLSVIPLVTYKILEIIKGREGEKGKLRLRYDMRRTSIEEDTVLRRIANPIEAFLSGQVSQTVEESLDDIFD